MKANKKDNGTLLQEAIELSKIEKVTDINFDGIDNIKSSYLYVINIWGEFYRYIHNSFREGIAIYNARIFRECISETIHLRIVLNNHNIDIDLYDYFTICKGKDYYGFLKLYIDYIKNNMKSCTSESCDKPDNHKKEVINVDTENSSKDNTSNSFYDSIDPATKAMLDKVCNTTFNNINEVFNYFQFMYNIKVNKSFSKADKTFHIEIWLKLKLSVVILDKKFPIAENTLEYINNFDVNIANDIIIWNVCTYILTNSIA